MEEKRNEGVIKFKYHLDKSSPPTYSDISDLEDFRSQLFKLKLIGEYLPEKLGYGNISKRAHDTQFYITATQTGALPHLRSSEYCLVKKVKFETMELWALGELPPSSEAITHFSIYQSSPQILYIFHIHDHQMWNFMLNHDFEQTRDGIDYGTVEMAKEAKRCIQSKSQGIFAMKGHEDGIISYGQTAEQCFENISQIRRKALNVQ